MAIYLNGQLVAGSNDGLKSITSAETVEQATTVIKAETVSSASIVENYTGQIEYIKNPGWVFDSTQLNTSHIYIQPVYDNIYIYAYCTEPATTQWFRYKIIGGEAL